MSFISARSRRDLREITNLTEFLARSRLSRRNLFHIGEISFVSQKYLSSRASLGEISSVPRPRSLSSRADLRDITNLAEFLTRSRRDRIYLAAVLETLQISPRYWRDLGEISFISPRSQRHYKSRRDHFHLVTSRRDLTDITNFAEISSRLTRSRRDLCHLGEISLISPSSRRDLVYLAKISATIQISPRSRRDLVNLGEISPISPRSRQSLRDLG